MKPRSFSPFITTSRLQASFQMSMLEPRSSYWEQVLWRPAEVVHEALVLLPSAFQSRRGREAADLGF